MHLDLRCLYILASRQHKGKRLTSVAFTVSTGIIINLSPNQISHMLIRGGDTAVSPFLCSGRGCSYQTGLKAHHRRALPHQPLCNKCALLGSAARVVNSTTVLRRILRSRLFPKIDPQIVHSRICFWIQISDGFISAWVQNTTFC